MIYRLLFIILIFAAACSERSNEPPVTFKPYSALYEELQDERLKNLKLKFLSIARPVLAGVALDSGWVFMAGKTEEGLKTSVKSVVGEVVRLPHRLEMPDTPLWYSKRFMVEEKGVITISADDGAQVFINSNQELRLFDNYFRIDTTGIQLLTVRVLNNAMSGGLRHIAFSTHQQFQDFQVQQVRYMRLKRIVEKVLLLQNPTQDIIDAANLAFDSQTDQDIDTIEQLLQEYPFLVGPFLSRINSSTYRLTVKTDSIHSVKFFLAEGATMQDEPTQTETGKHVKFTLNNLQPSRTYYYQIKTGKTTSPVYSFETEKPQASFSFNVWADSQSGDSIFSQNVKNTLSYHDAFGIGVGDLVSHGASEEQWMSLYNILGSSTSAKPYYLIAGNHDYDGYYDDLEPQLYKKFTSNTPAEYFSWTYSNCAFIALNPNENFPIGVRKGSEQHAWFMEQIQSEAWKGATWRFVLLHQPPYSQGWTGYHGDQVIRDLIEPHIESAKIDFVVSGHTHDYERLSKMYGKQQVMFLIVGGAGGSLEPEESSASPKMDTVIKAHHIGRFYIDQSSLKFEAINLRAETMDSFSRSKQ